MERANRRLVESAGKKYGRARISKTVEREVVGPDGSVKMEKTTEVEYHKIRGLTAATFFHSDARGVKGDKGPPDPSDHFHNELMKDVTTLDGKTVALDQGYLLDNMKAIGAEGQAILAEEAVKAGFKVEFYVSKSGERTVGIAGFSDGLIEENSKRGASIKDEKAKGLDDQKAWASKRGGKEYDPATLEGIWRKKFAGLGFKKDGKVEQRLERQPAKLADKTYAYKSDAEIIRRLTEKEAHFSEGDIRREVYLAAAEAAAVGDFDALKKAEARIERIAASPDLKPIDADFLSAITGRDATGEAHFYSKRMLTEEVATIRAFEKMAGERTHTLPEEQAKRIISEIERKKSKELGCDFKFRDDQIETILHATDGRRFALISAKAGTGKTTSLTASIEILEQQGRKVILASSWNKAASQISADTSKLRGKEVFTIVQLRGLVEKGEVKLDGKTTVMVDEAGLASHAEVTWLREAAEKSGCSVLLQGDESQTAAVSTGKPFRRMVESGLVEVKSLTVITRQRDDDQKRATLAASRGDFAEAVDVYRKAGMVQDKFATKDAMVEKIAADFIACSDPLNQKICVATKNADVQALNDAIRTKLVEEGKLGKTGLFVSAKGGRKVELAQGERICLTARLEKNETISNALLRHAKKAINRSMKLRLDTRAKKERVGEKSEFGTVTKITGDGFYLRMDGQKKDVFIKRTEVPDVAYGYAATTSKLQGSTVETAFHMHGSFSNAALAYVSLSRHKKACHIYASEDEARTMVADMGRKELKLDSLDLLPPEEADRIRANLGMPLEEAKAMLTEVKAKADDALARSSVDGTLGAAEKAIAETAGRVKSIEETIKKIEETAKEWEAEKTTAQLERGKENENGKRRSGLAERGADLESGKRAGQNDGVFAARRGDGVWNRSSGFGLQPQKRYPLAGAQPMSILSAFGLGDGNSHDRKPHGEIRGDSPSSNGNGEKQAHLPMQAEDGDGIQRSPRGGVREMHGVLNPAGETHGTPQAEQRSIEAHGRAAPTRAAASPEFEEPIGDAASVKKNEPTPHATAGGEFLEKAEATAKAEPIRAAKPTGEAAAVATPTPKPTGEGGRKKAEATAKAETPRGSATAGPLATPTPMATANGESGKPGPTGSGNPLGAKPTGEAPTARILAARQTLETALDRVDPGLMRRMQAAWSIQKNEVHSGTEKFGVCAIRTADGGLAARGLVLSDGHVMLVEQSRTAKGGVDYETAKLRIVVVPEDLLSGREVGKTVTLAFDAEGNASLLTPPAAVSKVYAGKKAREEADWNKLDVMEKDAFGMTAAHHAAARGDVETLNKVLAVGGDPCRDFLGRSVASLAGRSIGTEYVKSAEDSREEAKAAAERQAAEHRQKDDAAAEDVANLKFARELLGTRSGRFAAKNLEPEKLAGMHLAAARAGDAETAHGLQELGVDYAKEVGEAYVSGRLADARALKTIGTRNVAPEEQVAENTAPTPAGGQQDRAAKMREAEEWAGRVNSGQARPGVDSARNPSENELHRRDAERAAERRLDATAALINTPPGCGAQIWSLLNKGVDVTACLAEGCEPNVLLANAPDSLPAKDLFLLLDAGADRRITGPGGTTAVLDRMALKAAGDGDIATLSRLAKEEVDLDKALRTMAGYGDDKAVETLLAAGADPDARDKNGRSALDEAMGAEKRGSAGAAAARKTLEDASAPAVPAAAQAPAVAARKPK